MAFPETKDIKALVTFFETAKDLPKTLRISEGEVIDDMAGFIEKHLMGIRAAFKRNKELLFYPDYDRLIKVREILTKKEKAC